MTSNAWTQHFTDMARGLVPCRKKMYVVKPQVGQGDIQMVTPTQADVERAKSDLKRKLKEASVYKPKRVRLSPQSGAGRGKKRKDKSQKKKKNSVKSKAKKKLNKARKKKSAKTDKKKEKSCDKKNCESRKKEDKKVRK